jgi:hypothetical protein
MRIFRLACLTVLALAHAAAAAEVHDDAHRFSFKVPDGYKEMSAKGDPGMLYGYSQGLSGNPDFMAFTIVDMKQELPHERLDLAKIKQTPGVKYELKQFFWKGFDIDVIVGREEQGDERVTVMVAEVPLAPTAIIVKMLAPSAREAELNVLMASFLAGLDGTPSWTSGGGIGMIEIAGIAAGVLLGGMAVILLARRRRRRS